MIIVSVQTLVVTKPPHPCLLLLCPEEDLGRDGECRLIPIAVGVPEATQIGLAMEGAHLKRPTTHDLFMDALTNLDAIVFKAEIFKAEGSTFYARLHLKNGERDIILDARPSDAISLALRQNAPIYMDEEVMKENSYSYNFSEEGEEKELAEFHSFLEDVDPQDFSSKS